MKPASRKQIEEAWRNDPTQLSEARLRLLGFQRWDKSGLMLIPITHLEFIPNGTVLHCIDGNKYVVGKDEIDDDTRGGILAYGIFPRIIAHDPDGEIISEPHQFSPSRSEPYPGGRTVLNPEIGPGEEE